MLPEHQVPHDGARASERHGRYLESVIQPRPVILGGVAHGAAQANAMIARGFQALVVGFDWSLLQRGIASAIADIKTGID